MEPLGCQIAKNTDRKKKNNEWFFGKGTSLKTSGSATNTGVNVRSQERNRQTKKPGKSPLRQRKGEKTKEHLVGKEIDKLGRKKKQSSGNPLDQRGWEKKTEKRRKNGGGGTGWNPG